MQKPMPAAFVLLILVVSPSARAVGGITIGQPQNFTPTASVNGTGAVVNLSPGSLTYIASPLTVDLSAMRAEFPTWTFNIGGTLNGTFNIINYGATATDETGGANLYGTYAVAESDPPIANLQFLQVITASGTNGPFLDNPDDTTIPFYYTAAEAAEFKKNGLFAWDDSPTRGYPGPPAPPILSTRYLGKQISISPHMWREPRTSRSTTACSGASIFRNTPAGLARLEEVGTRV